MSKYPLVTLAEIGVRVLDCDHRTPKSQTSGYPYVTIPNIVDGRLDLSEVRYISRDDYLEWTKRTKPQAGDLIITRRARVGDVAVVPPNLEIALGQNLVILRSENPELLQDYLRWVLRGSFYRQEVAKFLNVGAVFDSLNVSDIPKIRIPVPPIDLQLQIARILAAFDDKIDLNRRMNAALEATARALFQSWFVDFDPVRAKAEGRAPEGMDAATAALFPDSFEDSALGPIPSGWRVAPLSEHIEAVRGLSYKGSGLTDAAGGLPMHNLNSVYEGGGYKYEGMKYYSGEYQERHLAKAGDLIVTNTEQGHDLLLIGYPALIPTRYPIGLFSHHLYRVRPLAYSPITLPYVYFLLKTNYFHDIVSGYANGTTVNMLHVNGLQRPLIVIPPAAVLARFDDLVLPMLQKQESSHSENERLAKTRDAMLPHLISGELRVTRE